MNAHALKILAARQIPGKLTIISIATLFLLALFIGIASAQPVLVNGANETGTIYTNTIDSYTFTANKGDTINVRVRTAGFDGYLELFGPDGALLTWAGGYTDDAIENYTATNSGTFTVMVSSWYAKGTGTYVLNLAQIPEPFIVPAGDEGGPLANGADAIGTITLGDQDMWTFTANKGDTINVRVGTSGFNAYLPLYGPDGALLTWAGGYTDDAIENYTATNSGTFTVMVCNWDHGGSGTYVLNLAQIPEPFIVPAGDEGGPLANGADAIGTITLGDQDMWTFTANKGDTINVRVGTSGFNAYLPLYGPDGALLTWAGGYTDDAIENYTATNSGTFTVMVCNWDHGGSGTYVLNLAQIPEPFIVPSGDQGGAMTGSAHYAGTITLGDLDLWAFTACTGDSINLGLNATNFNAYLALYGPDGALLTWEGGHTVETIGNYTATNCGTFTVLVCNWDHGGTGTYGLTANGLSYELKECLPKISGTNFMFNGVGGNTNANAGFVLYATTNIAAPLGLWIPVLTNQFDQFGVFSYTNIYNPTQRQQYYRFTVTP